MQMQRKVHIVHSPIVSNHSISRFVRTSSCHIAAVKAGGRDSRMNSFALTACHASSAGIMQVSRTDQSAQTACGRSYGAVDQTVFVLQRSPQGRPHQPSARLQPCFLACVFVRGSDNAFVLKSETIANAIPLQNAIALQELALTSALCSVACSTVEVATPLPGTFAMPTTGQLLLMLHRFGSNLHGNQ